MLKSEKKKKMVLFWCCPLNLCIILIYFTLMILTELFISMTFETFHSELAVNLLMRSIGVKIIFYCRNDMDKNC